MLMLLQPCVRDPLWDWEKGTSGARNENLRPVLKSGLLCGDVASNLLTFVHSLIAQGEISMSVAFPTHVWKMPNICKHIIVWLFSHMCAFSHTYVSKSKHVWKIAPRCKYTNVFGFFQTCWVKVKHLPKWTCVVFYTQVWLFSNIFAKSQTCVEKTIMFHWIFPYRFFMEIKILLISAQFCLIYFHFLKTHLSWNVYNLTYDLNFFVFSVWFGLPSW